MSKTNDNSKSSFHYRLRSNQNKSKFKLNRSPLRDLTRSASKLLNVTTNVANRKCSYETSGEDQEWKQKPVAVALNPAPSVAFPPPPSAISPNKRRYPSPPSNYYEKSFRDSSNWEKPELKPRAKSNDRGSGVSSGSRLQGGIGSIRKSAIRDVMRKFKCEDNTRVGTTYTASIEKRSNDITEGNVQISPKLANRGSRSDWEEKGRSSLNRGGDSEETKCSHNRGLDNEDDTRRSSYSSSAVSMTLLRVEVVGLKSKVCEMEAQVTEGKNFLEKEKHRHKRLESHLEKELEYVKAQLEQMKTYSREEKLNVDSKINHMRTDAKNERLQHKKVESQLLEELGTLQKNQYHIKRSKQELQKKYQDLSHETKVYKERLREARRSQEKSDEKVCQLKAHIKTWQNEEKSLHNEIESIKDELIIKNKNCSTLSEAFKEKERKEIILMKELKEKQTISLMAQTELNKFQNMTRELKQKNSKAVEIQNESRTTKQQNTELVHSMQKRISKLEDENKRSKEYIEKYRKKKKHLEHEKGEEVDKLKEELKHAQFRVQVLKTEVRESSPKNNKVENRLRKSIDELQDELNKSRQETEEVQTRLEGRFSNIESDCNKTMCEHDGNKSQNAGKAEIEMLTKQLNDARSRSRRIVIKSETELAKVRDAEEVLKECARKYEEEVKKWKAQFYQIERKYKEEIRLRKEIEVMLQKKSKHLPQDKSSLSLIPATSEHNNMEDEMLGLTLTITKLTSRVREMKELLAQNCEIKNSICDELINDFDKLKIVTSKLEMNVKKDSANLQNAVDTYENRIEESSMKHQKIRSELQQSLLKQDQQVKKQKQTELNLLSKYAVLKGRYAQLQQDYESCKMQAEEQEQKHDELESWFLNEFMRMEPLLPKRENSLVQQRLSKIIGTSPRKGILKKMRMKLQQGPSMEEVEVRLREDDESVTSVFSQNDVSNLRAEIKHLKDLLKELQVEAAELKSERDRERKLRKLSAKQTNESHVCLLTEEQMQEESSPNCDVQAQLTTIAEDNDIK